MKKLLKILACVVGVVVLVVVGYVIYLQVNYDRIADNTLLAVENDQSATLKRGAQYTAVTGNIGFGAYDPDYSFFMDVGVMADGTEVSGKHARAVSLEAAQRNTQNAAQALQGLDADFYLLQEVDVKATRSYGLNQADFMCQTFADYGSVYASNFHSAYLAYPLHEPHGSVEAGLLTLSRYQISQAVRRSYPVDQNFVLKFFDLDRCFSVQRIPVAGGGELVLMNSHMSAYDEGGVYRAQQMQMLSQVLAQEAEKGSYVIVGGDFNQIISGSPDTFPSKQRTPEWIAEFDYAQLPAGFSVVNAENCAQVPTCRGADIPYEKGVNFTTVIDGFIVSDNVKAVAEHIDTDFSFSDHNPVQLTFTLT